MRRTKRDGQRKVKRQREYQLSPEGLAALREANRRVQPWTKTTGPKTPAGKERSKVNALRHGERTAARMRERHEVTEVLRMFARGQIAAMDGT